MSSYSYSSGSGSGSSSSTSSSSYDDAYSENSKDAKDALELAYLTRHLEKDIKNKIQVKKLKKAFRGQLLEMLLYCLFLIIFSLGEFLLSRVCGGSHLLDICVQYT